MNDFDQYTTYSDEEHETHVPALVLLSAVTAVFLLFVLAYWPQPSDQTDSDVSVNSVKQTQEMDNVSGKFRTLTVRQSGITTNKQVTYPDGRSERIINQKLPDQSYEQVSDHYRDWMNRNEYSVTTQTSEPGRFVGTKADSKIVVSIDPLPTGRGVFVNVVYTDQSADNT